MQLTNIVAVVIVAICVRITVARPSDNGNADSSVEEGEPPQAAPLTSADSNVSNVLLLLCDNIDSIHNCTVSIEMKHTLEPY